MSLVMMVFSYVLVGVGIVLALGSYEHSSGWFMASIICIFVNLGCAIYWTIQVAQRH